MIPLCGLEYREVWFVDFEFAALSGERPQPVCLVAWELASGRRLRLWQCELQLLKAPPYAVDADVLFVAYYASAELGCHLALGWTLPANVLDLFTEFRNLTNGLPVPCGSGLLGALAWFGLPSIEVADKVAMRQLVLRGGPWSPPEREALLAYCESDVAALEQLLVAIVPALDLPRALGRGQFMKAAAQIEYIGVPVDSKRLATLRLHWADIQEHLVAEVDAAFGVFEGTSFKAARFAAWLIEQGMPWPRLESGALDLSIDTFREMARANSRVAPLSELRWALSQMRLAELAVGSDGRNRCLLSAFRARTGRNQPSNSRFIFGPAVWLRSLIQPAPGTGLAYIDWSQQEFGIAAALSGDSLMTAAYQSGDPYLEFAKQAGAVPSNATKATHPDVRDQFKACVLAVQYGMGAESLAQRIGQPLIRARELLRLHQQTYRQFWRWSDGAVDHAMLRGKLWTVFGWTVHTGSNPNPRFLRNFLMQGNGAELLRLACVMAIERGVRVCAPVHDALLIEAPLEALDAAVERTQTVMDEASAIVLGGFRLRSDVVLIRHPERYVDARGRVMWDTVERAIGALAHEGAGGLCDE